MKTKQAIIGVGRPRCGKKTHLEYIARELEAPYIDMGEHLRQLKAQALSCGSVPQELEPLVKTGYVDDRFILTMFKTWIMERLKSPYIILDGIPRTVNQARLVLPFLKNNGGFTISTLWFATPAQVCMMRPVRGGREDDTPEKAIRRMQDFDDMTAPMRPILQARTRFVEVDNSNREIHAVREEIAHKLGIQHILSSAA